MPLSIAQKQASAKWVAANKDHINACRRAKFAEHYASDPDKFKKSSAICYQRRREAKIAKDLGNYYFKKHWASLRAMDVF